MLESELKSWFKGEVKRRCGSVKMIEPKSPPRSDPDLIILGRGAWAAFDFKRNRGAEFQPNQDLTMEFLDDIGWGEFVYPDNAEEVLNGLEDLFPPF
jgi:hypothetical protein